MDLKKARIKRGLSQSQLANEVGMTQVAVSNIETGLAYPRATTRKKIEDVLGIEVDWIATRMQPGTATKRGKLMHEAGAEEGVMSSMRDFIMTGSTRIEQGVRISLLKKYLSKFEKAWQAEAKTPGEKRRK